MTLFDARCTVNDERYQLDATVYLLSEITLHVSGIYVPIFRSIGSIHCILLHMVFGIVKENCVSGWFHFMLFVVLC